MQRPFLSRLALFMDDEPHSGEWNMAMDRALLETVTQPVLRVYHWKEPTVTLGYRYKESELTGLPPWPVVRRWTGGGVVFHDGDTTYSLVVPRSEAWSRVPAPQAYEQLHSSIAEALAKELGLPYKVATTDNNAGLLCFSGWSRSDIVLAGKKVGGAGQRRTNYGLLHQGSLQLAPSSTKLRASFWQALAGHWAEQVYPFEQASLPIITEKRTF